MYLLKPAPFCIFDEVDAPLDDANIDKFNNISGASVKDSQFIIVTHNKRTNDPLQMSSTESPWWKKEFRVLYQLTQELA